VTKGIQAILRVMQEKAPEATIVLTAIFRATTIMR